MIGQIDIEKSLLNAPNDRSLFVAVASVVNSLVDAVNTIQKEREAEKAIFSKMENVERSENVQPVAETRSENVPDLDIQLSWIGYLCRFWDYDKIESTYAILDDINVWCEHPYRKSNGNQYKHCEPVKPDSELIYHGE